MSILDADPAKLKSKHVGLNLKHSQAAQGPLQNISRIFPMYGLNDEAEVMQSHNKVAAVPSKQVVLEAQYKSKLYFKQKYEMKDFIEVLLRAKVNPNKREQ